MPSGSYGKTQYGLSAFWIVATAGSGTASTVNTNVDDSVCPKNWQLPTGRTGGAYSELSKAYGGTGATQPKTTEAGRRMNSLFRNAPINVLYEGISNRSSYLWTSSAGTVETTAYNFDLFDGALNPGMYTGNDRAMRFYTRCYIPRE